MDTSWWPAVAAVVAVVLLVLVPRRARRAPHSAEPPHAPGPAPRPGAGDLWSLPGGRPCLVLGVRGHWARVAWITGKYDDRRAGVIPLPPGVVGSRGGFLEADRVTEVSVWEFARARRLGTVDPAVWDEVKGLGSASD
ncbi:MULTISPECIES: hypothetical protein [unclassified Streptomyces]|uniref:hypothetical protein n=1 Tax=unclassified Streptomyces TaxID=2593676 RepID=UPI000DC77F51|nr:MULTISPECIES: hypothetical protein [unclassified Streptomyces]AWZ08323.1 hypothetical protein DRB89_31265 [Streptomyces sp. ICC4]AWZ14353.1 hypothetical protein DRB96_21120 [Streptomyces sp. ICC1]